MIDATFGGGGYSRSILQNFNVEHLIAIDRDPISKIFSSELEKKYPGKFNLVNGCFSQIDKLVSSKQIKKSNTIKFDIIVYLNFYIINISYFHIISNYTNWSFFMI